MNRPCYVGLIFVRDKWYLRKEHSSHLSKGTSGFKQKCTQMLTPYLRHSFSSPRVSPRNHFLTGGNSCSVYIFISSHIPNVCKCRIVFSAMQLLFTAVRKRQLTRPLSDGGALQIFLTIRRIRS